MRIFFIYLFLSCAPIFVNEDGLNELWEGKHQTELIEKIGEYTRVVETLQEDDSQILIWEASKDNILIPMEKLGSRYDKKGTSISSLHVYVDKEGYILNIKRSVW